MSWAVCWPECLYAACGQPLIHPKFSPSVRLSLRTRGSLRSVIPQTPHRQPTDMYSLGGYGNMIADRIRIEAFSQALRKTIRPGAVVMAIGTGPGIMARLASQLCAGLP